MTAFTSQGETRRRERADADKRSCEADEGAQGLRTSADRYELRATYTIERAR